MLPELRAAWGAVWSSANDGSCRPLPVSSATDKFQQQAWKCSPNLQWVITFSKSREDSTLLFGLRSSSVLLKTRNNGIRLPGSRFRAELIKRVRVFKRLLPASSQCNYNVISENMCAIFQPFLVVGVIVIMSPAVTSTKPGRSFRLHYCCSYYQGCSVCAKWLIFLEKKFANFNEFFSDLLPNEFKLY